MSPAEPPSRRRWSRRAVLASAGPAAASALAGCSALDSDANTEALHGGDWCSYGNGPTNANRVDGGTPELTEHEILASADWPYAPPVVHDDVAYFATSRQVLAVSVEGTEQWSKRLDAEISGAPALDPDRDRLYVPTRTVQPKDSTIPMPASVTVLSSADGAIVNIHRVGDCRTYGVSIADGDIYVRCATACVRLAPDGTERWRRSLEPLVYDEYNLGDSTATQVTPALVGKGVYVPDRDALVKLDRGTGKERWRVPVDTPYAAAAVGEGGIVQTGWQETVAATPTGEVRWRRDLHSRAGAATADGAVYIAANDLHELDAATGDTTWQAHLPNVGIAPPVVTEQSVLVASGDVRAFRREADERFFGQNRKRWEHTGVHAATYASPVVAAGRVFVVGPTGLVALRAAEGD